MRAALMPPSKQSHATAGHELEPNLRDGFSLSIGMVATPGHCKRPSSPRDSGLGLVTRPWSARST
jgi:hypothetical protein